MTRIAVDPARVDGWFGTDEFIDYCDALGTEPTPWIRRPFGQATTRRDGGNIDNASQPTNDATVVLTLPPRSFTVVEGTTTGD